jgi:hypothetical protein
MYAFNNDTTYKSTVFIITGAACKGSRTPPIPTRHLNERFYLFVHNFLPGIDHSSFIYISANVYITRHHNYSAWYVRAVTSWCSWNYTNSFSSIVFLIPFYRGIQNSSFPCFHFLDRIHNNCFNPFVYLPCLLQQLVIYLRLTIYYL